MHFLRLWVLVLIVDAPLSVFLPGCGAAPPCTQAYDRVRGCADALACNDKAATAACQGLKASIASSVPAGDCSGPELQTANRLNGCELNPNTCECKSDTIGNPCINPGVPVTSGVSFVNNSPFCATGLCLVTPPSTLAPPSSPHRSSELAICTRHCQSDADCADAMITSSCGSYVCAVPSILPGTANHCCEKLCVCATDLVPGYSTDGNGAPLVRDRSSVPIPKACLPVELGGESPGPCVIK